MSEKPPTQPKTPTLARILEQVAPFTDADVEKVLANQALLAHASPLTLACMVLSAIARIEADRALILPSACSTSHPEIRYQGETCPLCEARAAAPHWTPAQIDSINAEMADGIIRECIDTLAKLPCHHGPSNVVTPPMMLREGILCSISFARDAALSRPSSAPGAGEVGK